MNLELSHFKQIGTVEINFSNILFNPTATCNQYKIINVIFCPFFGTVCEMCVFYFYDTSQFGLATFQVLSSYMWLVVTLFDSVGLYSFLFSHLSVLSF